MGRLLPNRNPLCLKLTISPGCGFHLFTNSEVPGMFFFFWGEEMRRVEENCVTWNGREGHSVRSYFQKG